MEIIILLVGIGILVFVWIQYFKQRRKNNEIKERFRKTMKGKEKNL